MKTRLTERSERKSQSEFTQHLFFTMYWVYILKNKNNGKLYYGYTNNLKRRLKQHSVSKKWKCIGCEGYASEQDAREREQKLKHYGQARTYLKKRLANSLKI